MKFYTPDGDRELTREDFVNLYADSYYLGNQRQVSGVAQCSLFIENEIDRLLKQGIETQQDIAHILAWKIGKIKHGESENEFVYASDWKDAEDLKAERYGKPFELEKLAAYIVDNLKRLEKSALSEPQSVLNDLRNQEIRGIGTVYLLTLLYFVSKGKYPIYDRFAMMAADAIWADKKPGEVIGYEELPDKSSNQFETVVEDHLKPYMEKLHSLFGADFQTDRNIDRALWVYGHLFIATKK